MSEVLSLMAFLFGFSLLGGCGGGGGGGGGGSSSSPTPPPVVTTRPAPDGTQPPSTTMTMTPSPPLVVTPNPPPTTMTMVMPPPVVTPQPPAQTLTPLQMAVARCPVGHHSTLCEGIASQVGHVGGFNRVMTQAEASGTTPVQIRYPDTSGNHGRNVRKTLEFSTASGGTITRCDASDSGMVRDCLADLVASNYEGVISISVAIDISTTMRDHLPPGAVVFHAAGNAGGSGTTSVIASDLDESGRWVSVVGTGDDGFLHPDSFSCTGVEGCIAAPFEIFGWDSNTLLPDGNLRSPSDFPFRGTSASAPIVAGVAATVWGMWRTELTADEIPRLLYSCAVGGASDGVGLIGYGRLDLNCLLTESGGLELPSGYRSRSTRSESLARRFDGSLSLPVGVTLLRDSVVGRDRFGRSFDILIPWSHPKEPRRSFIGSLAELQRDLALAKDGCKPLSFGDRFVGQSRVASFASEDCVGSPSHLVGWAERGHSSESLFVGYGERFEVLSGILGVSYIVGGGFNRNSAFGGRIVGSGELTLGPSAEGFVGVAATVDLDGGDSSAAGEEDEKKSSLSLVLQAMAMAGEQVEENQHSAINDLGVRGFSVEATLRKETREGLVAEFGVSYNETEVNLGIGGYRVNAKGGGVAVGAEARLPFQF